MRLLIKLIPLSEPASLPLDNYPLAAFIYRSIWMAAPDYAEFLHDEGYPAQALTDDPKQEEHKRFKFFVFSRIEQPGKRIAEGRQFLRRQPVELRIASPIDEQMELLAAGLITQGTVSIGDKFDVTDFDVLEIMDIPSPVISRRMRFRTISPIFLSVDETRDDGSRTKQHLRAEDPRFAERVRTNLIRKYSALTGDDPEDDELEFRFEGSPKSQLVQYKGTHHHCYMGEFTVTGSEELIRLGWECGFGEANSKGFGMVK
jgi:CRISPR-associated endoribonuclease Cas6